jgi:hypothetical protein
MSCPAKSVYFNISDNARLIKQLIQFMAVSFLHTPFSCIAPKMRLSTLLSNELSNLSSVFDSVHVSNAYVSIDVTSTNTSMFRFSLISSATLILYNHSEFKEPALSDVDVSRVQLITAAGMYIIAFWSVVPVVLKMEAVCTFET